MAGTGLEIIQVARHAAAGGGVGGAAAALDDAFHELGVESRLITAETLGRRRASGRSRFGAAVEIADFTLRATLAVRRARKEGRVVVVHGDALGGDIYVDHGLHKALLARRPWLLANPLHVFIWAREELRHARPGHRRVACLSPGAEATLRRVFPLARRMPVFLVRNGVDTVRFRPDPERMAHAPSPQDCRLVFVGHEFGRKGLRHTLRALTHLGPGVTLTVVGGRPRAVAKARRRAEEMGVAERVSFLGIRDDVDHWLRRGDILLLPSAWEASPLVALEAMACGVPVLLAGAPGGEDLLGDGRGGRMVERDGRAVAAAVEALMADRAGFLALRRSARAWAEGLAWTEVARDYVALAQAVLREREAA